MLAQLRQLTGETKGACQIEDSLKDPPKDTQGSKVTSSLVHFRLLLQFRGRFILVKFKSIETFDLWGILITIYALVLL